VKLVVTPQVYSKLTDTSQKLLEDVLKFKNFDLKIANEQVLVALTVTDRFLSLGMFGCDGKYDVTMDLLGEGEEAIQWGRELFEYFWERSEYTY
jgi:predicted transcriptional regulator